MKALVLAPAVPAAEDDRLRQALALLDGDAAAVLSGARPLADLQRRAGVARERAASLPGLTPDAPGWVRDLEVTLQVDAAQLLDRAAAGDVAAAQLAAAGLRADLARLRTALGFVAALGPPAA